MVFRIFLEAILAGERRCHKTNVFRHKRQAHYRQNRACRQWTFFPRWQMDDATAEYYERDSCPFWMLCDFRGFSQKHPDKTVGATRLANWTNSAGLGLQPLGMDKMAGDAGHDRQETAVGHGGDFGNVLVVVFDKFKMGKTEGMIPFFSVRR